MKEKQQWIVLTTDKFNEWFVAQPEDIRQSVLSSLNMLRHYGPQLSRPYADTVKASKYTNMKELRIQHKGLPLRAFFIFDPYRQAIVLCAGNKSGNKLFYEKMIKIADAEFDDYLRNMEK